ncbi:hypothetical protein [Halorubrum laminariae]|uniref:Uncharacterized protein n=1 Tax=Halorubrum laminariae TaxID=1433523 RepID=A0ABD6C112_9EURY|nr:hypothetical protein [Halorubrum laminariae]
MASTIVRIGVALLVAVALVGGGASVAAQSDGQSADQPAWADDLFDDMEGMQSQYNNFIGEAEMSTAERQVFNRIKGNTINVYIVETDVVFSFRMASDGTITELEQSRNDDADLKMLMTRETAESLATSENPVPGFVQSVRNGERTNGTVEGIVITGEDGKVVKQVTWGVINAVKGFF